ncbi:MAG: hypothetical protein D6741_08745 [Planctomycetota bacterium]|nr:MAG: hypothetical protein D6741_08745 [Planctomycetota bacterium]
MSLYAGWIGACAVGCLAVVAWHAVYRRVEASLPREAEYTITAENIELTTPPGWIHHDIRREILRNATLEPRLSLLSDDLCAKLFEAARAHPWIAEVRRVEKSYPHRVVVDVVYRKPVCMVRVPGGVRPVDAEGVVLPSTDFTPIEAGRYPLLDGIHTTPAGPAGCAWGDPAVAAGARVAAVLADDWQRLKLARILPLSSITPTPGTAEVIVIETRDGSRILWGDVSDTASSTDATARTRLERLREYVRIHGTYCGPKGPQVLDLRLPSGIHVSPLYD